MPQSRAEGLPVTLPFEKFWAWLQGHSNCIVRAGTADMLLFDHDDYHWHLASDQEENALLVQLVRGKDLVGEMVVMPNEITYVQFESIGPSPALTGSCGSVRCRDSVRFAFSARERPDGPQTTNQTIEMPTINQLVRKG